MTWILKLNQNVWNVIVIAFVACSNRSSLANYPLTSFTTVGYFMWPRLSVSLAQIGISPISPHDISNVSPFHLSVFHRATSACLPHAKTHTLTIKPHGRQEPTFPPHLTSHNETPIVYSYHSTSSDQRFRQSSSTISTRYSTVEREY